MKFYYLPHPHGFESVSGNHFSIYNETQQAKLTRPLTNDEVRNWSRFHQDMNRIHRNINVYHKNKNKTFQENDYIASRWIIK